MLSHSNGSLFPGQERSFQSQVTLHFSGSFKAAHLSCSVSWSVCSHTMNFLEMERFSPTPTPPPLSPHHSDHPALHVAISCEDDASYRQRATPFLGFLLVLLFWNILATSIDFPPPPLGNIHRCAKPPLTATLAEAKNEIYT